MWSAQHCTYTHTHTPNAYILYTQTRRLMLVRIKVRMKRSVFIYFFSSSLHSSTSRLCSTKKKSRNEKKNVCSSTCFVHVFLLQTFASSAASCFGHDFDLECRIHFGSSRSFSFSPSLSVCAILRPLCLLIDDFFSFFSPYRNV